MRSLHALSRSRCHYSRWPPVYSVVVWWFATPIILSQDPEMFQTPPLDIQKVCLDCYIEKKPLTLMHYCVCSLQMYLCMKIATTIVHHRICPRNRHEVHTTRAAFSALSSCWCTVHSAFRQASAAAAARATAAGDDHGEGAPGGVGNDVKAKGPLVVVESAVDNAEGTGDTDAMRLLRSTEAARELGMACAD